ncbi:DUF3304 domain-containing protein [Burkholderia thailandensis]|nr:hypothetical protein [Burkholderia thailandensis]
MKSAFRLTVLLIAFVAGTVGSRANDHLAVKSAADEQTVEQSNDDAMSLKLRALNYTDVPIGVMYVNDTWGGSVSARIGSGGGKISCCVSLPNKWHPGLSVTVRWQDDRLYRKDRDAMASRVVDVEKYDYFTDGNLWVMFFPGDKIKVYASPWAPGGAGFPENLKAPSEACPGRFTLLNNDPRCPQPDKRIKP